MHIFPFHPRPAAATAVTGGLIAGAAGAVVQLVPVAAPAAAGGLAALVVAGVAVRQISASHTRRHQAPGPHLAELPLPTVPLAGVDVDALAAAGAIGYVDTAICSDLAAHGVIGRPGVAAQAARVDALAGELAGRATAALVALDRLAAVDHQAAAARAEFLAELDGRAAA